jgi:hypothetical protein
MSTISCGIIGVRFSVSPLKNALFGADSVIFTVRSSTASARSRFWTIEARWNADPAMPSASAVNPAMRSRFQATSSAVHWRPFHGATSWMKMSGRILSVSSSPSGSTTIGPARPNVPPRPRGRARRHTTA